MRKIDNIASDMIPIRLIISIAVIAAMVIMISVGYNNLSVVLAKNQVENECRTLESKLYTMISSGIARNVDEINSCEGTKRTHTFNLPDTLIFLAFGVDPDPNNDGILETGLTCNGSVIFYKVMGDNKQVIWLPDEGFRFREGELADDKWIINDGEQGFISSNGGKTTLTFELVQKNHEIYILIQGNDGIEL